MMVFVTGATGFIGSAVVQELLASGHRVKGLARSEASAEALREAGAEALRGDLTDEASLRRGASSCDGVVHTGFVHDFSKYKEMCELDRRVVTALGAELVGTDKPMIVTSGTLTAPSGRRATEEDVHPPGASATLPRAATEEAADALVERGARVGIVRPSPSVHGAGDHGFVPMLMQTAREKGVVAYVGDGDNRWNAVHRLDAARLYVRALERAEAGARYHAVAEPEIPFRDIAIAMGKLLALPVRSVSADEAASQIGWLSWAVARDCPTSSDITRRRLDWTPTHPTLLDDLASGAYRP